MKSPPQNCASPETDICYSTNAKPMKKIALILTLPLAVSLVAVAAQKKDASKKSPESATSEQHVVLNPADLKWGDAHPGLPPGARLVVLAVDSNNKEPITML